ncbi:MAG: type II toxin-antitoxin system HicB family antitoxin [Nitrospinae bacterium]|nr:type II toxin-antitoxin system HicB family antitoxin [Nitrospinota bacterium]
MRKREFTIVIEQDEDGYFVADVPSLPGCHTQAKSMDVLLKRTKEAVSLYLDANKTKFPQTNLIGVQRIAV